MDVIYSLIPGMTFFGLIMVAILIWVVRKGQYEDMEGNASRILLDDDEDAMLISQPNGHGRNATPDDETCHARFPLPQAGDGANESLRELHVKAEAEAETQNKVPPAAKQ